MCVFIILLAVECFTSQSPLRIYGGIDAKSGAFPYIVRIERQFFFNSINYKVSSRHSHLCTGSALSPVWVVSAAHCLNISPKETVIRYGHETNSFPLNKDSFSEILYTVKHPLYAYEKSIANWKLLTSHDIGLLKTTPMNIESFMKVSAVDYKTFYGHEAVLAGFGVTTKTNAEGKVETNVTLLLGMPLQLLTTLVSKCLNSYMPLVPGICLAPRCKDVNMACPGDSGGPLIHPSGLIGLLSAGLHTGFCLREAAKVRVDVAGYIVPVAPYVEWIYSYISL